MTPRRLCDQSVSEHEITSLYITRLGCEAAIYFYGKACPAVNHYYQGGQMRALDAGVLCVPGSYGTRKLESDKVCVNV